MLFTFLISFLWRFSFWDWFKQLIYDFPLWLAHFLNNNCYWTWYLYDLNLAFFKIKKSDCFFLVLIVRKPCQKIFLQKAFCRSRKIACTVVSVYVPYTQKLLHVHRKTCTWINMVQGFFNFQNLWEMFYRTVLLLLWWNFFCNSFFVLWRHKMYVCSLFYCYLKVPFDSSLRNVQFIYMYFLSSSRLADVTHSS